MIPVRTLQLLVSGGVIKAKTPGAITPKGDSFYGIRNAEELATCLDGYDRTAFPEGTQWTFTRFCLPQAFDAGYRLVADADLLWDTFESAHGNANLPGKLELPMESFVRAVEITLKESELKDSSQYRPESDLWKYAVQRCGYVQSRHATGRILVAA